MTEPLLNTAIRAGGEPRPGSVGPPVDGVELRLVDDQGHPMHNGWFRTGYMATRDPDGHIQIVGRRATDLIKSGGTRLAPARSSPRCAIIPQSMTQR